MRTTTVYECSIIEFSRNHREKGNITAINGSADVPFEIQRVYYLYDVPGGEARGGHAHRALQQLIVAASGSFDLLIDDGHIKRTFSLNRPYIGVYMPAGVWREIHNFSSGAICLVLASLAFDEEDYIRDYKQFIDYKSTT